MDTKKLIIVGGMLVAAGIIFTQVRKMGTPVSVPTAVAPEVIVEKVKYVDVLATARPMNTGQRITEDAITTIQWPAEALNANLISIEDNPDAASTFVNALARQPMGEGETLTRSKVIMAGDSGVMAALLKPGMRAVTTRISVDTAAGGFIQPGDRVDIILRENFAIQQNNNGPDGQQQQRGIQRTNLYMANILFENVKVLAIDQTFATGPETGAALVGSIATFELSPDDAELLQESEGYGDIYLTLRGANGSNAPARSRAKVAREEAAPPPSSLTIYRNGQPTAVALQER
jgi:pilus assembly protein CpaB